MCSAFIKAEFPSWGASVGEHSFSKTIRIGDENLELALTKWPGQDEYYGLRALYYKVMDACLVCYSVADTNSFEYVKEQWIPEIRRFSPKTPLLLVGLQTDRRQDADTIEKLSKLEQKPVTSKMGMELAAELQAVKYLECTALTGEGVDNVFEQAAAVVLAVRSNKKDKCSVM